MRFSLPSIKCSTAPPSLRLAERTVIKSLCTVQTTKQCSAVVVIWEKPPNIWLTAVKNAFVGRLLNFRVRMLLKSAVKTFFNTSSSWLSLHFYAVTISWIFKKNTLPPVMAKRNLANVLGPSPYPHNSMAVLWCLLFEYKRIQIKIYSVWKLMKISFLKY